MDFSDDFYFGDVGLMNDEDAINLIFALLDELPELLEEIAPDGWNKSIYRHPIRRFHLNSQSIRISKNYDVLKYIFHKKDNPGIPYKNSSSLNTFIEGEPFPDTVHYKATIFFYLCIIIAELSLEANMVYSTSGAVRIFEYYHVCRVLPKILAEHNLWPKDKIDRIHILDIFYADIEEDSTPFYKAAFRALKKMGYDWYYYNSDFAAIVFNLLEYHQIKWSPSQKNIYGLTASDLLAENELTLKFCGLKYTDLLDEQELCDAFNNLPPSDSVLAYLEVYDKLPKHYPLCVSYYKSLFGGE